VKLAAEPVHLPATATYPGLQPFIQQEAIAAAESAVTKARELLDQANRAVGEAKQQWVRLTDSQEGSGTLPAGSVSAATDSQAAIERAKSAARLAQSQLVTTEAKLGFVRARIAADAARFAAMPDPSAAELALGRPTTTC
jgi:hypothetical protein